MAHFFLFIPRESTIPKLRLKRIHRLFIGNRVRIFHRILGLLGQVFVLGLEIAEVIRHFFRLTVSSLVFDFFQVFLEISDVFSDTVFGVVVCCLFLGTFALPKFLFFGFKCSLVHVFVEFRGVNIDPLLVDFGLEIVVVVLLL